MTTHYIVTPVRNAVHTIDATIWSVVSQAGGLDIHYHIQDGVSNDGTLDRIEAWGERIKRMHDALPSRVYFTFASEPDQGMYDAIVNGFAGMSIPPKAFMSWCNADDALWPGALAAIARLGGDLPDVDWVMGWPAWFDDNNRLTAIERLPRYPQAILATGSADGIHWPFVQQESTFWRKRLWDRSGGLDVSLRLAGDWDLWTRFARLSPLVHVHRQLGAFYIRPGQQSANMDRYRLEMDVKVPTALRQPRLRQQVRRGAVLTSVPMAVEDNSGCWKLTTRYCSRWAGLLARVLLRLPVSAPPLTKLFYNLW